MFVGCSTPEGIETVISSVVQRVIDAGLLIAA
jgi:hypothetical protein